MKETGMVLALCVARKALNILTIARKNALQLLFERLNRSKYFLLGDRG